MSINSVCSQTTMKPYEVYLLPDAVQDLENLYHYIADKSGLPETAWAYIEKLREKCRKLAIVPICGQQRDDLMTNLRITPLDKKTVAAFLVDEAAQTVLILNIFYGGRDYETLLLASERTRRD